MATYTTALQQDLATAGYYSDSVDGTGRRPSPRSKSRRRGTQPVTGTADKATAEALQAELLALGRAAAQISVATAAAVQQTLILAGFWDGPADGPWTLP
ncbi:hypothetical protein [Microbacterium deminutum]|uniref:Uncharacterized protein n=1 Tax=Microbacterium deminutum TaxID=344164 RepID=A0ABN2QJD9_9MICO